MPLGVRGRNNLENIRMIHTAIPDRACPPNNVCKYDIGNNPQNAIILHCNTADAEPINITICRNM